MFLSRQPTHVYLMCNQANPELVSPVDFGPIRALTTRVHQQISSGTIDAPSWDIIRCAKLATRMYAPLGTRMALGDYVRLCRAFVEAFKYADVEGRVENSTATSGSEEEDEELVKTRCAFINALRRDIRVTISLTYYCALPLTHQIELPRPTLSPRDQG